MISRHSFPRGIWRLADPRVSLASFAGMVMAALFAATNGETGRIVPAQAATLASFPMMALGCSAGYLWGHIP